MCTLYLLKDDEGKFVGKNNREGFMVCVSKREHRAIIPLAFTVAANSYKKKTYFTLL